MKRFAGIFSTPMKMQRRVAAVATAMGGLVLAGCGDAAGKADTPPQEHAVSTPVSGPASQVATVVASLGTVFLTADEVRGLLAAVPPAERQQLAADRPALDRLLQARLAEKALAQQARNQGWLERSDVSEMIQAATERIVLSTYLESVSQAPADYPSAQELQVAYEQNQAQLQVPARYRLSQIFIAAPYGDAGAVEQARRQAADLARRAAQPKADFASLAREFSQDQTSAGQGGEIGLLPLAQVVPELREVIAGMKAGQIAGPVQLPAGFHVLKLQEIQAAGTPALAEVEDELRAALRAQRQKQAARAYLDGMLNTGTVSVDGKALAAALE